MTISISLVEQRIFEMVSFIKLFNNILIKEYKLIDIPFNSSGKQFPKIGEIEMEKIVAKYRFHGRGCTFWLNEKEIFFNVDTTSKHSIILTPGGVHCFFKTSWQEYISDNYEEMLDNWLVSLETNGVFMKRKSGEEVFHVNETWFEVTKMKIPFNPDSKNDIDWL